MSCRSVIIGHGAYLPENLVTNDELAKTVDTSDDWIRTRTGITQRYLAASDQTTSDMAYQAALASITRADIDPQSIDLIVVATTTPDLTFPSTAVLVQSKLGIEQSAAFDVQAVCSGFVYGLATADSLLKSLDYNRALVIGADKMSSIVDWNDRNTCVLFGDGAGAYILEKQDHTDSGILSCHLYSQGKYAPILKTNGGASYNQATGTVLMQGKDVFKHAVEKMGASLTTAMDYNQLNPEDIDLVIPHQANQRIIDKIGERLHFPAEKIISTVCSHGNTSAASIPLATEEAFKEGKITKGQNILLTALGGGLAWGSAAIKW